MTTFKEFGSRAARFLTVTGVAGLGVLLAVGTGSAAPATVTGGVSAADVAAAKQAAVQPAAIEMIGGFLVHLDEQSGAKATKLDAAQARSAAVAKRPAVVSEPLPVYSLNPAFVLGSASRDSVAEFAYLSVKARSASGQDVTVWLTREPSQPTGWIAANVTTGTEEVTFPAKANPAEVFTEPQINAWYRVTGGQVLPLNEAARAAVGSGVSLEAYQKQVHAKYADKMPGSAYVKEGKLGGYTPSGPSATVDGTGTPSLLGPALGVLAAGAVAAGVIAFRRRLSSQQG